ncbi:FRG domain-containing protein [Polaromonas sp. AER18D-145]|uniref:FRG domain-containing protein n=1 Tax=Polaromonas sp. AER18D-145 TaxID=1977060 RepID=UPI001141F94E|nr:FRG domain-containing protein [Polaromonas sp. AER18D-145]
MPLRGACRVPGSSNVKPLIRRRAQMKALRPSSTATRIAHTREWIPESFDALLAEIDALKQRAADEKCLLIYRGHRRREWRLDATFVRSVKSRLFDMEAQEGFSARLKDSGDLNSALTSLLLLKFGTLLEPSAELKAVESDHGVDAWFELMKRYQQYPEEDVLALAGTNFLDWSQSSDVALFFGNDGRDGEGALFVCDATATGETLQVLPVVEILRKVREQFMRGEPSGLPLLFSPPKQIANERARNQQAVYFAQMELRLDMLESWRLLESSKDDDSIILKIVLPRGTEGDLRKYLEAKSITEPFVYPDKVVTKRGEV